MGILGTNFKKIIVEFKISNLEYPFVSTFILNKTISSFGAKFAQNLGNWKVLVLSFGSF